MNIRKRVVVGRARQNAFAPLPRDNGPETFGGYVCVNDKRPMENIKNPEVTSFKSVVYNRWLAIDF